MLRLSRSANPLDKESKNLQQSRQGNLNDTNLLFSKNQSLSTNIADEVSIELYNDAKRRMERTSSRSQSKSRPYSRNPRSNKYLKNLLEADLEKALSKREIRAEKMNYYHTSEVLKDLGFMFTDKDHNDKPEERMLFLDFWKCLRGDENDGINPTNLKTLL